MSEKFTDEQLAYMANGYGYVNAEGLIDLCTELLALRAERANKP